MKADSVHPYNPNFNAEVAKRFADNMRSYFNAGKNRIKNQYRLNNKIEEYKTYGFNDYTVELVNKYAGWGTKYSLIVVKNGTPVEKGKVLAKRSSYKAILQEFFDMDKQTFQSRLSRQ